MRHFAWTWKYAVTLAVLFATHAGAHDIYEVACCANRDCKPIPASEVSPTKGGWLVRITGEVIGYNTWPLKRSPDGLFHRCAAFANFGPSGRTKCLYIPDTFSLKPESGQRSHTGFGKAALMVTGARRHPVNRRLVLSGPQ